MPSPALKFPGTSWPYSSLTFCPHHTKRRRFVKAHSCTLPWLTRPVRMRRRRTRAVLPLRSAVRCSVSLTLTPAESRGSRRLGTHPEARRSPPVPGCSKGPRLQGRRRRGSSRCTCSMSEDRTCSGRSRDHLPEQRADRTVRANGIGSSAHHKTWHATQAWVLASGGGGAAVQRPLPAARAHATPVARHP